MIKTRLFHPVGWNEREADAKELRGAQAKVRREPCSDHWSPRKESHLREALLTTPPFNGGAGRERPRAPPSDTRSVLHAEGRD